MRLVSVFITVAIIASSTTVTSLPHQPIQDELGTPQNGETESTKFEFCARGEKEYDYTLHKLCPRAGPAGPVTPDRSKSKHGYNLGVCGSQEAGPRIGGKGRKKPDLIWTPKTDARFKPPEESEDEDDAEYQGDPDDLEPSDFKPKTKGKKTKLKIPTESDMSEKKLSFCTSPLITLNFRKYPSSGTIITEFPIYYGTRVTAFRATNPDPCSDDFTLEKLDALPTKMTDGIWAYKKQVKGSKLPVKGHWDTEHVMDAQIVKKFFMDTIVKSKKKPPISHWENGLRTKLVVNMCNYFNEFWVRRWKDNKSGPLNGVDQVLSSYPGFNFMEQELLLLPSHLNIMKANMFTYKERVNAVGRKKHLDLSFHARIDQLRDMILLIQYLSQPEFISSWVAVAERIRNRLEKVEVGEDGASGIASETKDYWAQNDKSGELYKSLGLSEKWATWIDNFVLIRIRRFESLILEYHQRLRDDYVDARKFTVWHQDPAKDKELKRRLQERLETLQSAIENLSEVPVEDTLQIATTGKKGPGEDINDVTQDLQELNLDDTSDLQQTLHPADDQTEEQLQKGKGKGKKIVHSDTEVDPDSDDELDKLRAEEALKEAQLDGDPEEEQQDEMKKKKNKGKKNKKKGKRSS